MVATDTSRCGGCGAEQGRPHLPGCDLKRNPFDDKITRATCSGFVALDNFDDVERRVRALLEGKQFTKVLCYEYNGYRPDVYTGLSLTGEIKRTDYPEREVEGGVVIPPHNYLHFEDGRSVWSISTSLPTQPNLSGPVARGEVESAYDKALRDGMQLSIEDWGGYGKLEMYLRTPEGKLAWWVVQVPEGQEEYVCNKCGAPKGKHALGESCNQNCGGKVVRKGS